MYLTRGRAEFRRIAKTSGKTIGHRKYSSLVRQISDQAQDVHSFISLSRDPYINLSLEHLLYQKSHAASTILFLYTNRPSVIIGRNQNPWLEVNLSILDVNTPAHRVEDRPPSTPLGKVDLVRRRSGGGTVFHDEGNVNWAIICPPASFTRDKHAEMVVRALRRCGIERARVNERHDIVLDQGPRKQNKGSGSAHDTSFAPYNAPNLPPLKVSGSAYKLTKTRAMHHGTCLLSSPNLDMIPHYLRSPAKPYIMARGVESVPSPVGNVGIERSVFEQEVLREFARTYGSHTPIIIDSEAERLLGLQDFKRGYQELKSANWTYGQTPRFQFSTYPTPDDGRERPQLPQSVLRSAKISLEARSGVITEADFSVGQTQNSDSKKGPEPTPLKGRVLYEIEDWIQVLDNIQISKNGADTRKIGQWLNGLLPTVMGRS